MNNNIISLLNINSNEDKIFKRCLKKVPINKELYTAQTVGTVSEVGMVIPKGFIVVDVDEIEASQILKNILESRNVKCIINKSKRGRHFIFKSNKNVSQGANLNTPIGLAVDLRTAGKGYIILPENNAIGREYESIPNELDFIPDWLIPDPKLNTFFKNNTLRLTEGSRDDTIYKYIMYLKDYTDYDYNQVLATITIINQFIFKKPLNFDAEVLPKIKPDDFKKDRRKVSQQEKLVEIGKKIIKDYNIRKYKSELYIYDGIKYIEVKPQFISNIILHEHDQLIKKSNRTEIIEFIHDYVIEEADQNIMTSKDQIATPTQIINLKTLETTANDGTIFNINNIQFEFNNNVRTNEFVDQYMESLFDSDEVINLIYEMIGYSMLSHSPFRKSFYLIGPAQHGKSFFLDIIKTIFGQDNVSAIDPIFIDRDPRMAKSLKHSLINAPDDISRELLKDESMFKKLISGELIEIDVKNKDSIKFTPAATFIMTSNYAPSFKNADEGIYSRLVLINFNKKIKPISDFIEKWTVDHYEYIVYKAIIAINKALKKGGLSIPESINNDLKTFKTQDNDSIRFIEETYINGLPDKIPASTVYAIYALWCKDGGYRKKNKKLFQDAIIKNSNYYLKQTTNAGDEMGNVMRWLSHE